MPRRRPTENSDHMRRIDEARRAPAPVMARQYTLAKVGVAEYGRDGHNMRPCVYVPVKENYCFQIVEIPSKPGYYYVHYARTSDGRYLPYQWSKERLVKEIKTTFEATDTQTADQEWTAVLDLLEQKLKDLSLKMQGNLFEVAN